MWKQLGFQVALSVPIECEADGEQRPDFVLDLTLADPRGNTNTALEAAGTHSTAYDPRPPHGIAIAYLKEIIVKLSFLHILPHNNLVKKRKANDTTIEPDRSWLYHRLGSDKGSMSYVDRRSSVQESSYQQVVQENPFSMDPTAGNALDSDDEVMLDVDSSSPESVVSSTFSQVTVSSSSTARSLVPLCNTEIGTNNILETNKFIIGDFARLVDSAFRTMICGERSPATKGVSCCRKSNEPMLAEIAPALFCPGYQMVSFAIATSFKSRLLTVIRRPWRNGMVWPPQSLAASLPFTVDLNHPNSGSISSR